MLTDLIMAKELALATAALFTGAAIYVNAAEQPARLALEDKPMLAQWRLSYGRAFAMQASLAIASALFALLVFWQTRDWRWFAGALVIFANWPYTLIFILPLNKKLQSDAAEPPGEEVREWIETWGRLHAVRSLLGIVATAIFIWAIH